MAIIKCKMCGGNLDIQEGASVAECEYCGSMQTVPNVDNEKKLTLFARANRLRLGCEFDKAAGVYESIVAEFPEEAEAYWGLVLCRYGIEYVDDPASGKKIPTCHRSSFDSVMEDSDFDQALENADAVARRVYREQAKAIETLRRGILEVSGKEEPYDIFICYKETDENGDRTVDSVIAQDVYDALTERGYRVFFSRISLEDKLGQAYEPYIFAALNSAKIMLAFGTDYEYYNAVWVKNEWSRFLKLMASGQKKVLIPCYKGIDAYDMPREFARLQAQDMGKVGALQDLLRGIEKILPKGQSSEPAAPTTPAANSNPTVDSYLKRGSIFLEDRDWAKADEYFDKVLDIDPENGDAYAGKLCAERKYQKLEGIRNDLAFWSESGAGKTNANYQKVLRFGSQELNGQIAEHIAAIPEATKSFIDATLKSGRSSLEQKEWTKADECFDKVLRFDPKDGDAYAGKLCVERKYQKLEDIQADSMFWSENENGKTDINYQNILRFGSQELKSQLVKNTKKIEDRRKKLIAASSTLSALISCSDFITVCVNPAATVSSTKYSGDPKYNYGQSNVDSWRDIVAVTCGKFHTVGLKADGTVVAVGYSGSGVCNVDNWRNFVAVACGLYHTVGLKADGTVVAVGWRDANQCNVGGWRDIVAVGGGVYHTVGLKADGTVVAVGDNKCGQCNVSHWHDIVAVTCGLYHTVGLKADGTVVSAGDNQYSQCNIDDWRDIVAVACGKFHTVGLRADGTVVAVGYNQDGQCNVSDWKLFDNLETPEVIAKKRLEAEQKRKEELLKQEKAKLEAELANLTGLFSGKRRKEIESRLDLVNWKLQHPVLRIHV